MVSVYGCPNWNGAGLRFHVSAVCALLVANGNTSGCNAATSNVDPLCASTMATFVQTWNAVTSDPNVCPSGLTDAGVSLGAAFTYAQAQLNDAPGCVQLETVDAKNCGYATAAEAAVFCSNAQPDACCSSLNGPTTTATIAPTSAQNSTVPATTTIAATAQIAPTAATTAKTTTAASSGSSDNALPLPAIIGGAAGGAVLLIAIIVGLCCCKRKKRTDEDDYSTSKPGLIGNSYNAGPAVGVAASNIRNEKEVLVAFDPQNADELQCARGDFINVKNEFDDGWAYGVNTATREEGYFPLDILRGYGNVQQQDNRQTTYTDYSRRESSIRTGIDSMYQSVYQDSLGSDEAVYPFSPERDDEVLLRAGDRVLVKKSYDDGWCYGTNLVSQREGYFPYDCLKSYAAANPPRKQGTDKKQRVSSMFELDQPGTVAVIYDYVPQQGDELALRVGDRVTIKQAYDDGWGFGRNETSFNDGIFPLDCLEGNGVSFQDQEKAGPQRFSSRISSMYTTGENSVYYN
ncbi:hypothetical protein BCR33DRAFT_711086 [Rhizoclosmatium globosum]|uniref:SH3 domain-containing protein n=1 Tax=Rhizoclosmatium globosum TaxID=329046 RepID=A0A1Y2D352_9FUNG|nr:hypothetical protein BCR33DRAFT_711086 [Rhizoclosmatium globosum]|eukprot:ORY53728.1 hypothetical protein BCR33DRAFT_711086 [Rhizoclosmatium globosum]